MNILLNNEINQLGLDFIILKKLIDNNIYTINDLWNLKRKDLRKINLDNIEIKQIVIKLQLYDIDLNKRIYDKS